MNISSINFCCPPQSRISRFFEKYLSFVESQATIRLLAKRKDLRKDFMNKEKLAWVRFSQLFLFFFSQDQLHKYHQLSSQKLMLFFLGIIATIFLSLITSIRTLSFVSHSKETYDVIIVGAGVSGIGAARTIAESNHSYIVLEGRDRVGGRLHTVEFQGVTIDLGGSILADYKKHAMYNLTLEYNITGKKLDDQDQLHLFYDVERKKLVQKEVLAEGLRLCKKFFETAAQVAAESSRHLSFVEAGKQVLEEIRSKDQKVQRAAFAYIYKDQSVEGANIADINALESYVNYDDESMAEGKNFLPHTGFGDFMKILAKGLNIHLNKEVISIERNHGIVTVKCSDGSVYECKRIIVSLPIGILKQGKVKFTPPLPQEYQRAVKDLGISVGDKIFLSFEENFWGSTTWLVLVSKIRGQYTFSENLSQQGRHILGLELTDDFNRWLWKGRSDQEIIDESLNFLRSIYGSEKVKFLKGVVTRWMDDPFALGAYSYVSVASSRSDLDLLAQNIDEQLWLIGEHTNQDNGNTNGAWIRAVKSAKEVMESL